MGLGQRLLGLAHSSWSVHRLYLSRSGALKEYSKAVEEVRVDFARNATKVSHCLCTTYFGSLDQTPRSPLFTRAFHILYILTSTCRVMAFRRRMPWFRSRGVARLSIQAVRWMLPQVSMTGYGHHHSSQF